MLDRVPQPLGHLSVRVRTDAPVAALHRLPASFSRDNMNSDRTLALRKFLIKGSTAGTSLSTTLENEIDLRSYAQVCFSSEHPEHPIVHLFDVCAGEGASKWIGGGSRSFRSSTSPLTGRPTNV